jgi:hypothetical protein
MVFRSPNKYRPKKVDSTLKDIEEGRGEDTAGEVEGYVGVGQGEREGGYGEVSGLSSSLSSSEDLKLFEDKEWEVNEELEEELEGTGRETRNSSGGDVKSIFGGAGSTSAVSASRFNVEEDEWMLKGLRVMSSETLGGGTFAPGRGGPGTTGTVNSIQRKKVISSVSKRKAYDIGKRRRILTHLAFEVTFGRSRVSHGTWSTTTACSITLHVHTRCPHPLSQ